MRRSWLAEVDPWTDVAPAAVLALLAACDVLLSSDWRGSMAVNLTIVPLAALSLAWRRVRPLAVLAVVMVFLAGLSIAYGGSQTWSSIFITVLAVYSSIAHGTRLVLATVIAGAGIAIHDFTDPTLQGFGDAIWSSTLLVFSIAAGLGGRAVARRTTALDERAETLEREEQSRSAAAAMAERRRIATELHDIISHSLGIVVLQAGAASKVIDRDPAQARAVLDSIADTGREAIGEMATLLDLMDENAPSMRQPQPTLRNVDKLIARVRDAGLVVELTVDGDPLTLPAPLDVSAFRIVQEGLTNVLKHAGAARVDVTLAYDDDALQISIADDGAGSPGGPGGRRGLAGIRERVAVFGGCLDAGTRPTGGWLLTATLPVTRP